LADQDSDKSQDATPHRRQEARDKGEVARSHDLASALVMLAGLGLLFAWWSSFVDFFGGYTTKQLGGPAWLVGDEAMVAGEIRGLLGQLATTVLPFLAMLVVIGISANLLQFGFLLVPEKLMPDLSRIDPLAGFGRIFSMQALVKLAFGLIKIVIVGWVAWYELSGKFEEILGLAALSLPHAATYLTTTLFWTTFKIAAALAIIALIDFGFQWWKNEQDMKMTTQEIREEMKNMQGDPQVAARRRQVQRELVKARLKSTVPKADVVVTNPTELAIALKYDPAEMAAPVVLAKGAGVLAARIRTLALEHGIPIIEKKPLAQALYKDVEVGRPIPGALYSAVAEIMAYVYQLKGKQLPSK
jgi:flagellar biosynthesis protein FlhB